MIVPSPLDDLRSAMSGFLARADPKVACLAGLSAAGEVCNAEISCAASHSRRRIPYAESG